MNKSIMLIGLPGSGKSYLSNKLKYILNKNIIDLDMILIDNIGPLQDYINKNGIEEFTNKEFDVCNAVLSNYNNNIISPGGSIVYYDSIMSKLKMKEDLIIIFLNVSLNEVLKRTNNFNNRGVVLDNTLPKSKSYEKMYKERYLLYKKYCHYEIKSDNITTQNILSIYYNHTS